MTYDVTKRHKSETQDNSNSYSCELNGRTNSICLLLSLTQNGYNCLRNSMYIHGILHEPDEDLVIDWGTLMKLKHHIVVS